MASVLARLGLPTRLVSRVGADLAGEIIIEAAREGRHRHRPASSFDRPRRPPSYHATLDDTGNLIVGIADMDICDEIPPAVDRR